jgi:hypothetical protein
MSESPSVTVASTASKKLGRCHTPGGATLGQDNSRDARKVAAVILEVLAGLRTPAQAAAALGVGVPRYYQLESRAVRGLVEGCEPRPRGPGRSEAQELRELRREHERLQRELGRQQTLVRLAQRSIGLSPPAPMSSNGKGKKRRRKPAARALAVAAHLQRDAAPTSAAAKPEPPAPASS